MPLISKENTFVALGKGNKMISQRVKKNLVIGFATNQTPDRLLTFCKSIREVYHADECDVVLGVNQPHIISMCRDYDIMAIPTISKYQKKQTKAEKFMKQIMMRILGPVRRIKDGSASISSIPDLFFETTLHPHLGRWLFYKRVLETMPEPGKILITDVSDVLFQDKFFDQIGCDKLHLFCETGVYGASSWNDKNYLKLYGKREFAKIIGQPTVCLGVLGGGSVAVKNLIHWIIESVYDYPNGGSDQVRGNRYVHLNGEREGIKLFENSDAGVLHINQEGLLGSASMSLADVKSGLVFERKTGKLIPIVHMYNRSAELLPAVQQKYRQEKSG